MTTAPRTRKPRYAVAVWPATAAWCWSIEAPDERLCESQRWHASKRAAQAAARRLLAAIRAGEVDESEIA